MEMKASHAWSRIGSFKESAANNSYDQDFYWAVCKRPKLRSVPTMMSFGLTPKYLPLPHPISQTMESSGRVLRNCSILGQALQRVWEKCGAMRSQTSQTCFFSISVGMPLLPSGSIANCIKYSSMNESVNEALISEQKKTPNLFIWKTVSLIIVVLISILIVVNVVLYIYLNSNPASPSDFTFANGIAMSSTLIGQASQLRMLMGNLARADPDMTFQSAELIFSGDGSILTIENIKDKVFDQRDHDLLYLFRATSNQQTRTFGVYSPSYFPLPSSDVYNSSLPYFTFDSGDDRQSTFFSLTEPSFLKLNSTNSEAKKNPSICKTYLLEELKEEFTMLGLVVLNGGKLKLGNTVQAVKCFFAVTSELDLQQKILKTLGFTFEQEVVIDNFEVYHLHD